MEERKDITAAIKESYLIIIWFAIIVGIRVFMLLSGQVAVVDKFGFFELAKETERELTTGVAFAYEGTLSFLMRFAGNGMGFVAVYQTILQILALILLFIGCRQFFGRGTALLVGGVLGISPWLISSLFRVTPGNFYFFHWAVVFLLIGIFYKRTEEIGWFRSNAGEAYLLITGFYMGVLCIWHYAGLLLVPFVIYAQIKNAASLRDRILVRQNILDMEEILADDDDWDDDWEDELEEEELVVDSREYMPTLSQSGVLLMGALFGAYCTLIKYTGITGKFIKDQLFWWLGLYRKNISKGLWLDIPFAMILWIGGTILTGIIFTFVLRLIYRKKKLEADILKAEEYLKESKSADNRKHMDETWADISEDMSEPAPEPELKSDPISEPETELETEAEPEPETVLEAKVEPEAETEQKDEVESEVETNQEEETEAESEIEFCAEPESESESISEPEIEPETKEEFEAEEESESESESEPEPISESVIEFEPEEEFEAEEEPKSEWEQDPDLEEEPEIEAEPEPEEEDESESEAESEPETISEPEAEPESEGEYESEEEPKSEWEQEPVDETEPEQETETETEAEPEPEEEAESESEAESEPETISEPEAEPESEGEYESEEEPESEWEQESAEESSFDLEEEIQPEVDLKESKKKVKLIDNPLPVPKRQVRPKVEFDIDDRDDDFDFDFDVDIDSNDDFDI